MAKKSKAPKAPRKGVKPRSERDKNLQSIAKAKRQSMVAGLYLRGKLQAEISKELDCAIGTVSNDLKDIRERWQQEADRDFAKWQSQELARVDEIEMQAWHGWTESLKDAEIVTTEPGEDGESIEKTTRKGQSGNPRFLEIVDKCIERRWKLLGFDKPKDDSAAGGEVIKALLVEVDTREEAAEYMSWRDLNLTEPSDN